MLSGSITALITPFRNGAIDEDALNVLVERQIAAGTHGLVPCDTTGESPTLSNVEHLRVVELCIAATGGRVPVIAGTGSNSTHEALEFTRHAEKAGADAALVVTPYYNKPTQAGLMHHETCEHSILPLPQCGYGSEVSGGTFETLKYRFPDEKHQFLDQGLSE